jgi:hypothetical protein
LGVRVEFDVVGEMTFEPLRRGSLTGAQRLDEVLNAKGAGIRHAGMSFCTGIAI